jgi:hypothetical protein
MPDTDEERRSARSRVFLTATIECRGKSMRVRIDDLSAHGARVLGEALPPVDTPLTLQCNNLRVDGYMAWVEGSLAGIGFGEPVQPDEALRKVSRPRPTPPRDFRRPGFRARPLTEAEQRMIGEWAGRERTRPGE